MCKTGVRNYVRVYEIMPECAKQVCEIMPKGAKLCQSVQNYARVCKTTVRNDGDGDDDGDGDGGDADEDGKTARHQKTERHPGLNSVTLSPCHPDTSSKKGATGAQLSST